MTRRADSINVLELKGKKHLTKAQIEERQAAEAALSFGKDKVKPPTWLSKVAKKEFRKLAKELLEADLITNVDVVALACYCDAYANYIACAKIIEKEGLTVDIMSVSKSPKGPTVRAQKNVEHRC